MTQRTTTERRETFERLVREAEQLVATRPQVYRLRVALLGVLGYVVLFAVLFVLVGLVAGSIWGAFSSTVFLVILIKQKLIIVLGAMVWAILKSLWVKIDPPTGFRLERERCPVLYDEVDALRNQLQAITIHEILLTDEFNAGITQTPRLGVFGWYRNTLILGLQLLLALSPEQARAVLAHEFGHLSGNHSRLNGWIYRTRTSWYRVMYAFDQSGGWGTGVMRRFFDWYAPYFSAYSFALARANEYEADAVSAELTSKHTAAAALLTTAVQTDAIAERYWQPLIARADQESTPVATPFEGLARYFLDSPLTAEETGARVAKVNRIETSHDDTHPAIKDRLAAIRVQPTAPGAVTASAANAWLGDAYQDVLQEFDRQWLERNAEAWKERYEETSALQAQLAELEKKPRVELSEEQRWSLASLTERFRRDADPLPLYEAYGHDYPEDLDTRYVIGRLKLARDDATGLADLEAASARFVLALPACEAAYAYFKRTGDEAGAKHWRERGEAQLDRQARAEAERGSVSSTDHFIAPQIGADVLTNLREQLQRIAGIKHAWLCEKIVHFVPEQPVYVLAYQGSGLFPREASLTQALMEQVSFPGETFLVMKGGSAKAVAKQVIDVGATVL
jgi:Zn-dependent protease with chaperone function